jgi:hypothetical protein
MLTRQATPDAAKIKLKNSIMVYVFKLKQFRKIKKPEVQISAKTCKKAVIFTLRAKK